MAKNLLKFETENDYRTAKRHNLIVPNISIVNESGNIYINGITASKSEAEAGDIIAYDADLNITYIKPEAFNEEIATTYTPVAIVVVPMAHTNDNSVIGMSLSSMSLIDPTNGSDKNEVISWGKPISTLEGYNCVITIPVNMTTINLMSIAASEGAYLPSYRFFDTENGVDNIIDTYTKWVGNVDSHSPSAYNKDLSKNVMYATENLITNCLQDTNGSDNLPETLISDNTAIYVCQNYSCTPYKNVGSWYLPSISELGYLMLRYNRIRYALEQVKAYSGDSDINIALFNDENNGEILWSSTQSVDKSSAWCINTSNGNINKQDSTTKNLVRAFAKF